jgi:condensin complex subunit 1
MGETLLASQGEMLNGWAPLVIAICENDGGSFNSGLRSAAVLTLCKFMCVSTSCGESTSPSFCENQLQLLFSVLRSESDCTVRANICVALGDLAVRHPNLMAPWTPRLYKQLRDADVVVRKTMLMVLTHLILNGMVRVKGQISEMALCLLDCDPKVVALANLFFTEFAKKDDAAVYNLLPDMVASLSASTAVESAGAHDLDRPSQLCAVR